METLQQGSYGCWDGSIDDVDYDYFGSDICFVIFLVGEQKYVGRFKRADSYLKELQSKLRGALNSREVVHLEGTYQKYNRVSPYFTLKHLRIGGLEAGISGHFLALSKHSNI